ncbi:hypothetical protein LTR86_007016 [Recurvomyces mirabilis]|nr:hypothetical protein LTR86_007016 [Recurvomyces mirabilis]
MQDTEAGADVPFLRDGEPKEDSSPDFCDSHIEPSRDSVTRLSFWPCLCGILLIILLMESSYLLATSITHDMQKTELAYLQPHIRTHEVRFSGAIRATPDGNGLYVPEPALDNQGRRYTGHPSPEVDAAWYDLIYGRYVRFTDSEVDWLNNDLDLRPLLPLTPSPNNPLIPESGFYGGPDMLHSLHCINGLRKHLHMDYYGPSMSGRKKEYQALHIDHCLEHLRQAVLCHGDMTPVTLKPVSNESGDVWAYLGETERVHVCRNGEELGRAWTGRGRREGRIEAE